MRLSADWVNASSATHIMAPMQEAGFRIYFVGGCVRNALISRPTHDYDLATDARPEEVKAVLEAQGLRVVETGLDHGTVTVLGEAHHYEVTTFRKDVETDGRHAVVAYSKDMKDDAARRDFTMNALYARSNGEVIDPLGGLSDLLDRRVVFIGSAADRIAEDYLRVLRFFRMHAWYGDPEAGLNPDGLAACAEAVGYLDRLSRERVGAEMAKLLSALDPAPSIAAMAQSGVLAKVMPGSDPVAIAPLVHLEKGVGVAPDWRRRAAALGGGDLREIWRLSKKDFVEIKNLQACHGSTMSLAEIAYRHGPDFAWSVALLRAAVLSEELPDTVPDQISTGAGAQFPLRGVDLMERFSGPALGQALRERETRWIASGFRLSKAALLSEP